MNQELKKAYEGIEDDLELVEYEGFYNHIKEWNFIKNYITNLQQENARLKDNWNSLKDIAKSQSELKQQCRNGSLWFEIDELLNKMKEIEEN